MKEKVILIRTGRLHEFDLAGNALTESNIPFFKQQEISGVKTAMYTPALKVNQQSCKGLNMV